MEKQQERLPPISSEEFPNSGEDSEEDEVIDYSDNSIVNGNLINLSIQETMDTGINYTKDNAVIVMSGAMNDQHTLMSNSSIHNQPNPLVPIISVTPHSPGVVSKYYPVLEENLQQLHEIYDSVQRIRMQDPVLVSLGHNNRLLHYESTQRLSWSCPSLQNLISLEAAARIQNQDYGSEPDLLTNCSNNSSPTYFSSSGPNNAPIIQCVDRRRSWTDLETTKQTYRRRSAQNFLQTQSMKQRSISLSSLDGEIDLMLDSKPRKPSTCNNERTCRSQISTHSLNEADFIQSGFSKRTSKCENQDIHERISLVPGVVGSRLTLQKSVSTPSIVTPPGPIHPVDSGTLAASSINTNRHDRHEKGGSSETETEDLHIPSRHEFHEDLIEGGVRNVQTSLDELSTDGTAYDDQHSEKTRRKRGSLFFRKKKKEDKILKKIRPK